MRHQPHLHVGPVVDVMSTLVSFLMFAGVSSVAYTIPSDEHLSDPGGCGMPPPAVFAPPPLTLHVSAEGVWVGRWVDGGGFVGRAGSAPDWDAVRALLASDRAAFPFEREVVLVTDDGEVYRDMITALDLTRAYGYDRTLLGGGPALPMRPGG